MVYRKKSAPLQESEGEDFSDVSNLTGSTGGTGNFQDLGLVEDDWVFSIVWDKAK